MDGFVFDELKLRNYAQKKSTFLPQPRMRKEEEKKEREEEFF